MHEARRGQSLPRDRRDRGGRSRSLDGRTCPIEWASPTMPESALDRSKWCKRPTSKSFKSRLSMFCSVKSAIMRFLVTSRVTLFESGQSLVSRTNPTTLISRPSEITYVERLALDPRYNLASSARWQLPYGHRLWARSHGTHIVCRTSARPRRGGQSQARICA